MLLLLLFVGLKCFPLHKENVYSVVFLLMNVVAIECSYVEVVFFFLLPTLCFDFAPFLLFFF